MHAMGWGVINSERFAGLWLLPVAAREASVDAL